MKAYQKALWRTIGRSKGRFLAIFAIVALGAGFFAGLAQTAPQMRAAVDQYLDENRFLDIQISSTLGFSDNDVDAVKALSGVADAEGAYTSDILCRIADKDFAMRVHALPEEGDLNQILVKEGRLPEKADECVLDEQAMTLGDKGYALGDTVKVKSGGDGLKEKSFTVVGFVESPLYLAFTLGTTTLGTGQLDAFLYVLPEAFDSEAYTALYVAVQGASSLDTFTDAYDDTVQPVVDELESLAEKRAPERREEVIGDAQKELDDGRAEYEAEKADAEQQLADAKQQLDDARQEIADNESKLADAQAELDSGKQELEDAKAQYEQGLSEYESQKASTDAQLAANKRQLDAARQQLEDAKAQYQQGYDALQNQKKELSDAKAQLDTQSQQLSDQDATLTEAETALAAQADAVEQARQALLLLQQQGLGDSDDAKALESQISAYDTQKSQLESARTQLEDAKAQLEAAYDTLAAQEAAAKPQLDAAEAQLADAKAQIDQNEKTLFSGEAAYQSGYAQAQREFSEAKAQLDNAKAEIASGEAELESGQKEIDDGRAQLEDAKKQLSDGEAEYETQKADAERQFADAEQELSDAQAEIDDVENAEWYVLDRHKNVGFASFESDADRMASLSTVFPVLFFLVAALVALTTMTRMVEEERGEIGAYKALGYSNGAIIAKYLLYGLFASLSGSVCGIVAGCLTLPSICWNAYRIMYHAPAISPNLSPFYLCVLSAVVCVAITLGATYGACRATLCESPAALLLPKTPQAGKRILLERIKPLWRHMNFTQKVTARNLFRYKKRLFMTIVGIAGCTALLLLGFGIRDSITHLVTNQYEDIFQYNMTAQLGEAETTLSDGTRAILNDKSRVEEWMLASLHSADIENENGDTMNGYVMLPENVETLPDLITLRDRRTHDPVSFGKDSVVLTEKLARELGISVGGKVVLQNDAGKRVSFTVTGITENYVYHYAYIDPALYEQVTGDDVSYNEVCGRTADGADEQALSDALQAQTDITTVSYTDTAAASFEETIQALNAIILVIIFFAGALSFIVLYNLTNINITERQRELATLRVLGFHHREAAGYIYRETAILTGIGCAIGLVAGIFLHQFTITTVEVDACMFGRTIAPLSYIWSILLTGAFTAIIDLVMAPKFQKIDMVESLKSVD